jgi:hypothetical protein
VCRIFWRAVHQPCMGDLHEAKSVEHGGFLFFLEWLVWGDSWMVFPRGAAHLHYGDTRRRNTRTLNRTDTSVLMVRFLAFNNV